MSVKPKLKPSLTVQINSDDNEQCHEVKYFIPVVKSAKNNHQLKKFNFTQVKPFSLIDKIDKQDKIIKLEREKAQLMESLQILKNGAVSAIVEKQEIINKLRKLFVQTHANQIEDKDDSRLQQLQNLLQVIKDLEQQRNILKQQVQKQKQCFYYQIEERQQIIQQLTNQLNWSTQRIDSLQKYDKLLQQKIKVMQQSNQNLSILLNQSQQTLKDQRKKTSQENLLYKNKSNSSIQQGSDSQNGSFWNARSNNKFNHTGHNSDQLGISICKSLDQSVVQSKIQQIKNQHQIQIQDLTDFYQSRIQTLKKLCEQYPELHFSNTSTQSKKMNQTTNIVTEVIDNNSTYSGFTNQMKDQQKILRKKLSLGSFKSGGGLRMDPIDERQQMESPRRSLRKQITSFYKHHNNNSQAQIHKNPSSRSIQNQSQSSNQEKQSQFSYKYFEYPSSSFKKNKSQKSQQMSQASSPRRVPSSSLLQVYQSPTTKQSDCQGKPKSSQKSKQKQSTGQFWQKLIWFASGTITGGILLKFGNRLFK